MKAIVLAATLLVGAFLGPALAVTNGPPDDSTMHVDLRKAGGAEYYLMCNHGTSLSDCSSPTLWQESNGLDNLQHLGLLTPAKNYLPDSSLLS